MRKELALLVLAATFAPGFVTAQGSPGYPSARHGGSYMHNYYFPPAPSSTPWAPAWSPDGARLAFSMAGSIWAADLATGVANELTAGATYHSSPTWSPDGRWIVYTADDGGATIELEVLDTQTGATHALTSDGVVYTDPVFSPDGSRLAYVSTKGNGYFNVYVRPIAGGRWAGDEIAVTADNDFGRPRLYFGPWDMHITPAWLPGGDELLIVTNRDVALGSGNVVRVPAEAGGIARARTVLAEQTLYRTRPDVSLDGARFVYSSTSGSADQYNNLYVQPTVGGEPYKLTYFEHDAFHPRWSPDGEWIAYVTNEDGLPRLELLETYGGARRRVEITERQWSRPTGTLSVRVLDSALDAPTEARVILSAADGRAYAPHDAYARVGGAGDQLFHTGGEFTVTLPAGAARLTVVKGFEYQPRTIDVEIAAGETTSATARLERLADLGAAGWFSGSTHVHMNYGGNLHNTLENLLFMSAAEDQDVVNELVANKDNRVLDYQYFRPGRNAHPVSRPDRLMIVGQEYRPPFYGHVFMIGLRDHIISPVVTGYEGTAIESLYPSNTDMLRKAKAQGAVTGYVHPFGRTGDPLEQDLGGAKGLMMDAALATADVLEWSQPSESGFVPLYALWNNGIRVAASGGEDSISDLHRSKLMGSVRTYVYTGQTAPDLDGWLAGLRRGASFVTNGPLVDLRVETARPGGEVALDGPGTVSVSVEVSSIVPLARVWLVADGEAVREIPLAPDRRGATFRGDVPVTRSGWIHLRAEGEESERFPLDSPYAQAFTNPVWVTVGGRPPRDAASARYGMAWMDRLRELASAWPGWRSRREIDHVMGQVAEARAVYEALLGEALERDRDR